MFTVIVRNGLVMDGTGTPGQVADVGVRGGRIEAIGDLTPARAETEIDATGLVVTPGFIDVHTHSDLTAFLPASATQVSRASVRQGVTTEVTGNCGWTPFPTTPARQAAIRDHIGALFGPAARAFDSYAHYREALSAQSLPTNVAPLVGHGTLRAAAAGLGREPDSPQATRVMSHMLAQSLDEGAFGMSSGLVYPPGMYSPPEELHAMGQVLARAGRIYATHMRNDMDMVHQAVAEAIAMGRTTGARVQLSHLKVAGRQRWGTAASVLDQIEAANAGGIDVRGDVYPYAASSTLLRALLPPWVNDGGIEAMLSRLDQAEVRRRVAREFETGLPGWQNFVAAAGWDGITIAFAPARPEIEGRSVAALADDDGRPPAEVLTGLVQQLRGDCLVVLHKMSEADVRTLITHPDVLIGSDTIPLPGRPHPRTAGTFARVLGRYVRQEQVAELPAMIKRMTQDAAERFAVPQRGRITRGYAADLVVFDPAGISDRATFADPLLPPHGVAHVLVAGRVVIYGGADTDAAPGQVLEPA
ncbi:N-acyl-D-amino-acid deacylase family protein [Pseudactinotalea sp. Z1732]|uniref:N-acyl-D-amino-acid deacylase family protein n=1 Tax=Micrococcales TaxID=85006 RepID=UPI003C7B61BA